jgi:hypothetical protein
MVWIMSGVASSGRDLEFHVPEFLDMRVEVALAALEILDVQAAAAQQLAQLGHAGAIDLVEVEQFLDLGQREAEPLAAQDPAQPRTVARAVEPRQVLALGLDQPLVLVEADGARRDGKLARQFGDAIDALRVARRLGGDCGSGNWHDAGRSS